MTAEKNGSAESPGGPAVSANATVPPAPLAENALTVGSLFSGIGGVDVGFERAGMRVAWQCEIDPYARRVLARHWPTVPCYDDVKELTSDRAATVDVLCGGFPCQDLSVAGRRAGLGGERSGLFHEFMRVADELAPRWVVIENVPGLLSSNEGRDMGIVLGVLADLGYGWCYRVLDAQYFGVAQRRRRVFIVGCAGDPRRAAQVLLESESCDGDSPPSRQAGEGVAATLGGGTDGRGWVCDTYNQAIDGEVSHTLRGVAGPELEMGEEGLYNALRAGDGGSSRANWVLRTAGHHGANGAGIAQDPDVALTLDTTGDLGICDGMAVRRLMPIECERLQGFRDGHTDSETDSARYRLLGNAVCVPVAHWIGERIVAADRGQMVKVGASHKDGDG